jgi:hypothetical protein
MRATTDAQRALAGLGNEPGQHSGHILITTVTGEKLTCHTTRAYYTDLGLVIDDENEKAVTFIPTANVALIQDAPAEPAAEPAAAGPGQPPAGQLAPAIGS